MQHSLCLALSIGSNNSASNIYRRTAICYHIFLVCVHSAFDVMTADPFESLDALIRLGFRRLLTSGRRSTALEGAELISLLRQRATASIVVMAGAGVTENNAVSIIRATGCLELHGSASCEQAISSRKVAGEADSSVVKMGIKPESTTKRITNTDAVRRILLAINCSSDAAPAAVHPS